MRSRQVRIASLPSPSTPMSSVTPLSLCSRKMAFPTDLRSTSLSARLMASSALLALLIAAAFGVFIYAVRTLDKATKRERHAKAVTAQSLQLEQRVVDRETGPRRFA